MSSHLPNISGEAISDGTTSEVHDYIPRGQADDSFALAGAADGAEEGVERKEEEYVPITKKPRLPPKIALDFVIENCRNALMKTTENDQFYNQYITAFVKMPWVPEIYQLVAECYPAKQIMNHKHLKKEITEAFGALKVAEKALRRSVGAPHCDSDRELLTFEYLKRYQNKLVFLDMCSGKGIQSFLMTFLLPGSDIVMIDFNAKIKLEHLQHPRMHKIKFMHLDIYAPASAQAIHTLCEDFSKEDRIIITCGLHLCGKLSLQLVNLFNNIAEIGILILSPCCMPLKKHGGQKINDLVRRTGWSGYNYWCLTVYTAIDSRIARRDMITDTTVESEKDITIVAIKHRLL
jgi:hypothetical protein